MYGRGGRSVSSGGVLAPGRGAPSGDAEVAGGDRLGGRAGLEHAVEHLGALGAARGELLVGLLVEALEAVQLVGDVERGEDGDLERIDGERARGDFAHAPVNELGQTDDVLAVAVGAD